LPVDGSKDRTHGILAGEERVRDTARHSGQERLFNSTDPSQVRTSTVCLMGARALDERRDRPIAMPAAQGYSSVQWDHACIRQVRIDGRLVNFLNVALACDVAATPWCQALPQQ
jgi:hypothetical protein